MNVYLVRYFYEDDTRLDDVKDKFWIFETYDSAKRFFEVRKDMLERKVRNETEDTMVRFEKRNYIHLDVCHILHYTLFLQRKTLL